ncbi:MAG: DUF3821 domain-containing protein [Methanobacteriota archaeon]
MRFWFIRILVMVCVVCNAAVLADIRSVPPGGTVFIGEEQLDISAAGISPGSQIAWWAPGTSLEEIPADSVTVSNPASFSVLSSSFSGKEGIWYSLAEKLPIFTVKQPRINLRISDTSSDFDATGKWLPRGHLASFQVDTNLYELRGRSGVNGAPVDIIIQSPGGAQYSSVSGPAGSFSLTGIPVNSALYDTGAVWNTGGVDSGTYLIHAECTANRMNLNNGGTGSAVSQTTSILIQDVNPLITEAEKREKENGSEALGPTAIRSAIATPLPSTTLQQIPVKLTPSVPLSSPGISVDPISPSGSTPPVEQPIPTLSPVIPDVSSSLPPSDPTSFPTKTSSTPFSGIVAVIALMYVVMRR